MDDEGPGNNALDLVIASGTAAPSLISYQGPVVQKSLSSQAPYNARAGTLPGEEIVGDAHGRKAYVGEPGGRDLLKQLAAISGGPGSVPEDAAFKGVFPDMRSTFPFTTIWSHENFSGEIIGMLPSIAQSEILWQGFEEEIAMFFSAWHLPSLRSEFQSFFRLPDEAKMTTPLGSLSTYLMICALGILVRASEREIVGEQKDKAEEAEDITTSRLQSELYREHSSSFSTCNPLLTFVSSHLTVSGAYHALRLCSFFSSPTLATVQAQIMISIFLLNSERASDAWPVLGSLSECRRVSAIIVVVSPSDRSLLPSSPNGSSYRSQHRPHASRSSHVAQRSRNPTSSMVDHRWIRLFALSQLG